MLHPIAGTRWRGATPEEDAALAAELLADPKERAEHLMLVDLGRNDLGRVCAPGTVEVVDFMSVERYSHVMHIVVDRRRAAVAEGRTAFDVLAACFPAGTLSGAPKPRAMEIIEELEPTRRGVYGGCVGYLDFAGDARHRDRDPHRAAARRRRLRPGRRAASSPTPTRPPRTEECRNKAVAVLRAVATAGALRPHGRRHDAPGACTPRREMAVALGLVVLGAALALVGGSRSTGATTRRTGRARHARPAPGPPAALALVALAGAGATLLVRTGPGWRSAVVLARGGRRAGRDGPDPDPLGPARRRAAGGPAGAAAGRPAGPALAAAPVPVRRAARARTAAPARHVGRPRPRGGPHRLTRAGTISDSAHLAAAPPEQ